ncbi:GyrI-like domain-containing protein [Ascidiimonas aurantiaca]|uniref:GyrI-like domain-containing protein n=1 Tax=Ascidiimonas aurantiaca TaxID=1685432 RepID=UPI0030EEA6C2
MIKKTGIGLFILLLCALGWYLFVKPYDYLVTFTAATSPGTVYEAVSRWGEDNTRIENLSGYPFSEIKQRLQLADSTLLLQWKIRAIHDSMAQVRVYLKDENHSLANKVTIPFSKSPMEKIAKNLLVPFKKGLDQQLTRYRVSIRGESETEAMFCACTEIRTAQKNKAYGMMRNNYLISDFLFTHKMDTAGYPRIEITNWDIENGQITFNFCFPSQKKDTLPESDRIFFKTFPKQKAIKAVYHGNYKSSDKAWYALYEYAKRNQLDIGNTPLEIFYNNPNNGGNDLKWKAIVFMPLQ